jgi:hypothetical protein
MFDFNNYVVGMSSGICILNTFLYLTGLIGNYSSLQSIIYITSTILMMISSICITLKDGSQDSIGQQIRQVIEMLSLIGFGGYFIIVYLNVKFLLSKKETIILILCLMPICCCVFAAEIGELLWYFNITNFRIYKMMCAPAISAITIYEILVNLISFLKFSKFKDSLIAKPLQQLLIYNIIVVSLHVFCLFVDFYFADEYASSLVQIFSVMLCLNFEVLLLSRLRVVILNTIQLSNA